MSDNEFTKHSARDSDPFDTESMFANAYSFLGIPFSRQVENTDVAILGIPYDLATTGRAGTRHGPQAVRIASANLRWEEKRWPWNFNIRERINAIDYGDLEFGPGESEEMIEGVIRHTGQFYKEGVKTLAIGGDHFVTLPLLRSVHQHYGTVALVHFDAHTDTYTTGAKYDHGSMFYHAPREGLVNPAHSIQLGIRTEYDPDDHEFMVLSGAELNDQPTNDVIDVIKQRVGDLPVYLTFDIDCLDPAYAPGTGTPVVGGISTDKALKIIRGLSAINIVAADVVEVAPSYDHAEITALAAATLLLELMYLIGSQMPGEG